MRVILLLVVLFVGCKKSTVENKENEIVSKPIIVNKIDFREFWNNLGQALQKNDTIALDNYLDTKVFLYGREDQDPRFELQGRDRIRRVREVYLSSGTYDYEHDISISYKEFFLNKDALNKEYVKGQDFQDIEDFSFKRNKLGEWKVIGVYTDTKKLKKP